MEIKSFYHQDTQTFCHLLYDKQVGVGAIIDPVMDYNANSGEISYRFADEVIACVTHLNIRIDYILETHVHADHLSAAQYMKTHLGGRVFIGCHVDVVQAHFDQVFDLNSQQEALFDGFIAPDECLTLGNISIKALSTPGHTPACTSYVVTSADNPTHAFVGDTLFMPDVGTARCDFPGGDADTLYQSIQQLFSLGDETILHMCHDYPPQGREVRSWVTVKEQRSSNVHCADSISQAQFVDIRESRDANLAAPSLILPSLQVNIRAGYLPDEDQNGRRFLKIPLRC